MIGPYPAEGNKCGVMIARPVPPGATVIAKPIGKENGLKNMTSFV